MKTINGVGYIVEDVGSGDWRICRMTDRNFCNETFTSQSKALEALNQGMFTFLN